MTVEGHMVPTVDSSLRQSIVMGDVTPDWRLIHESDEMAFQKTLKDRASG
jgi:hypothetical protein